MNATERREPAAETRRHPGGSKCRECFPGANELAAASRLSSAGLGRKRSLGGGLHSDCAARLAVGASSSGERRLTLPGQDVGPGPPEAAGGAAAGAEGGRLSERGGAARPAALLHRRVLPVPAEEGEACQRLPGVG